MPQPPRRSPVKAPKKQPLAIRLLVMDVDGVLTDASINLDDDGREFKRFNVRDGLAITSWIALGLHAAVITRRSGGAVSHRMRELGIRHVIQGSADKGRAITELAASLSIPLSQTAFIADDWPDAPAMRIVALPIAVADAAPEIKALASLVTKAPGGDGAVRQAVEHILKKQDMFTHALARFGL